MEALGVVEGAPAELETFLDGAGDEHDVLGVTVAAFVKHLKVGLLGAGGQTGRRSNAVDVPEHRGHFGEIRQSDEFLHQRNARPGRRGHAAGSGPSGTDDHPGRSQFVFGLHHGASGFAVLVRSQFGDPSNDAFSEAGGRRDGVPRKHLDATEERAEGGGFVAFHEEATFVAAACRDRVRVLLGEVFACVVAPEVEGGGVELNRRGFSLELLANGFDHSGLVNAKQFGQDADVDDVRDHARQFGVDTTGHLRHGDRVRDDVLAVHGLLGVAVPHDDAAGFELSQVVFPGGRVHEHLDVGPVAGCLVAGIGKTHNVPGRKARNVGGEEVLPAHFDAHVEQGLEQDEVGRLRAGSVRGGDVDGEVVDDGVHGAASWWFHHVPERSDAPRPKAVASDL